MYASDQTHFSVARALRCARLPRGHAARGGVRRAVPAARRPGRRRRSPRPRGGSDAARDRRRRRVDQHRLGRRRRGPGRPRGARGPVAPRRRRLRRGRAAVPARRASRAGTGAGRQRHDRPAQVVLPGLRHRRAGRAPARGPPDGRSTGRPSTTGRTARRTSRSTGTSTRMEGTRRFRALKLWMSWKHLGTEGLGGLVEHEHRPGGLPRRPMRRGRRLRGIACEPELYVVCFRHLPDGLGVGPGAAGRLPDPAPTRPGSRAETAWVSITMLRGRTYLRAGFVNYLATAADIDRCSPPCGRASEGVLEQLDWAEPSRQRATLATSKRTVPDACGPRQRGTPPPRHGASVACASSTASYPPPKPLPRRVLTSQNTRVSAPACSDHVELADADNASCERRPDTRDAGRDRPRPPRRSVRSAGARSIAPR